MSVISPDALVPSDSPGAATATPVRFVGPNAALDAPVQAWAGRMGFRGKAGETLVVPNADGGIDHVLVGTGKTFDPMSARALSARLPEGLYRLEAEPEEAHVAALAFLLGRYAFDRYKTKERPEVRLVAPDGLDVAEALRIASACALAREMVDTPPADMGPLQMETIAREIAEAHGASISVITGDDLLEENYPAIHAVGRAAAPHRAPRIIEIGWNLDKTARPLVALVGKGVAFDTGGLDIKSAAGMRNMKKDMGGAAHALGLAQLVMGLKLPVRLHLLVPAVENAIGPDAFRPGEVLATRQGLSVEVDNTDAEGRLVLCDALTYAAEAKPGLMMDFATLTGAARIALGPDLPALFCSDDALAADYLAAGQLARDPLWRMPLWRPYLSYLKSNIADVANSGSSRMAGCITAALYLERFVPEGQAWTHVDVYSWNDTDRPGKPAGGEAQGLRAAWQLLKARFAKK